MGNQQGQLFRPPRTPFEVNHLAETIFGNLGYTDLQNCRLVSRSWNASTSNLLKIHNACRHVRCRLDLFGQLVIEYGQELLNLIRARRSRFPIYHDNLLLPSFQFDSNIIGMRSESQFDAYFSQSAYYDCTIAKFLTNPLLSNLVGSVTLNRHFNDLDSVFEILTKLPNLKQLKLKFKPDIREQIHLGWEVPSEATSSVQTLELQMAWDRMAWDDRGYRNPEWEHEGYIRVFLQVCNNLKSLKLVDNKPNQKPFESDYIVNTLKHPDRLEKLEIKSLMIEPVFSFEEVQPLTSFINLKSLDLFSWGQLFLTDFNSLIVNGLAANLQVLRLRLKHSECPQQLIYCNSMAPGMNVAALKHVILSLTWPENDPKQKDNFDWYEEWNFVEGALTLTEARIVYEGSAVVDLRHFKHLNHFTIIVRNETTLEAALAAAPSAAENLQVTVAPLKTDQELKCAV